MKVRVLYLGITLMVVGLVASVALGMVYAVTRDRIIAQKKLEEALAFVKALPGIERPDELREERKIEEVVRKRVSDVEKVFTSDEGMVILMKAKGYGGPIRMAVGIGRDGEVKGISVITHNETPGLGGEITTEKFLRQFRGKTSADPIEVGEDVQAITGATISSRAAAKEVRDALKAFEDIRK